MVGTLDHLKVMFDDDEGVASLDEQVERLKQYAHIMEVQTRGRFIEDKQRVAIILAAA